MIQIFSNKYFGQAVEYYNSSVLGSQGTAGGPIQPDSAYKSLTSVQPHHYR